MPMISKPKYMIAFEGRIFTLTLKVTAMPMMSPIRKYAYAARPKNPARKPYTILPTPPSAPTKDKKQKSDTMMTKMPAAILLPLFAFACLVFSKVYLPSNI